MSEEKDDNWGLAAVINAIGTAAFPVQLLGALDQLCHIDHVGLFAFDGQFRPGFVAGHSATRAGITDQANSAYQSGKYFRHDPNLQVIGGHQADKPGLLLTRQRAEDIADPDYRAEIYERYDLAERVSLIDQRGGHWFSINLYRDTPVGAFSDSDIERLQQRADVVSAVAAKHIEVVAPAAWSVAKRPSIGDLETRIGRLSSADGTKLSAREVEVCARAVIGISGEGIALDLGVKQSTVATLRKRGYTKLGISTVHELFALCLGLASGD